MPSSRDRISNSRPKRARNSIMTRRNFSPMAIAGSARLRKASNSMRRTGDQMKSVIKMHKGAVAAAGSLPPCGGEVERGVNPNRSARGLSPSLTLESELRSSRPHKGGGNRHAHGAALRQNGGGIQ